MLPLLLASSAFAVDLDEYDVSLDGYYRVRAHSFNGLYTPTDTDPETYDAWERQPQAGRYVQHRLRLAPSLNYQNGRAEFHMMADALDDGIWGDNEQLASTPVFANDPTNTGLDGQPASNFKVKRAWAKFQTPVGVVTVGRQASNWGLGLLANDGDGFDDTFGENHFGNSFDRFVYATKPLAVANAITGKGNADLPLFFAVGFDRLVEDPQNQYYGYKCDPDDPDDDPRCAPTDDHSYSVDRDTAARPENWWAENDDDVWEMLYVLIYKGEDVDLGGTPSDLTAGFYAVNRRQGETESNVWIYDAYVRLVRRHLYIEGEGLTIRGSSRAIELLSSNPDQLYKETGIWGAVGRVGYTSKPQDFTFEMGWASGDEDPLDETFTNRPLHPDYNVGLLLYEEVLSRASAIQWTESADGLWSNGGVYNSIYVFPNIRRELLPGWNAKAGVLLAKPHKPDGAVIKTDEDADAFLLGWEADAGLDIKFQDHMLFALEGGFGKVTDRIDYAAYGLTDEGRVWTVQTRIAYAF